MGAMPGMPAWQIRKHMAAMPPARQLETVKLNASGLISVVLALHVTLYHKQLIDHSKYHATKVPTMPEMRPDASDHRLRMPREEIFFIAQPKIHSHSQIFRYGRSIFRLPHRPIFQISLIYAFIGCP